MKETRFLWFINLFIHASEIMQNIPSHRKTKWVSIDGKWTKIFANTEI